jgi:hypothetical protein
MTHETVDETIDRVAGEMSAVTDDPGLAVRVRQQLSAHRRPPFLPVFAAVSIAGALVIAIVVWPHSAPPAPAGTELVANAVTPIASLPQPPSSRPTGSTEVWNTASVPSNRAAVAFREVESAARAESVAATDLYVDERSFAAPGLPAATVGGDAEGSGPAPLALAALVIPPVASFDAVEIAPLDVAPLDVPQLQAPEEPEEQR